jgi:hypothetical protein
MAVLSDFALFLRAVVSRWQAYITGSLFTAIAFVYEHVSQKMISENVVLWGIAGFFITGAFMAWREQTMKVQKLTDTEEKDFEETYYSIVEWIRQGDYPFFTLREHHVDEFSSNDLVVRLCNRLASDKHPNPFDIISTVIAQSDWLYFLKWARGRGIKFHSQEMTYEWAANFLKERGERPMAEIIKENG